MIASGKDYRRPSTPEHVNILNECCDHLEEQLKKNIHGRFKDEIEA